MQAQLRDSPAAESVKAEVSKLLGQAAALQNAGQIGEMRRALANAATLLKGQPWGPEQEFAWSLALRPERVVSEPASPLIVRLSQFYPCPYKGAGALELRASLINAGSGNAPVRQLGVYPVSTRDWIDQPFGFDVNPGDVAEGAYRLKAELLDGGAVVATIESPVELARGILSGRASIEERLARIPGHESTKATIRNPYVLAETVNIGRRHLNQADFGIPFTPQPAVYDFPAGLRQSAELLKALEAGQDPLWRAKGDHERHYWFEPAGEMMPYRVYVPEKWDGRSKLPMLFVLHGATRDDNFYFDRDGHILTKLAEQHGYLVVSPFGYRPTGRLGRRLHDWRRGNGRSPASPGAMERAGRSQRLRPDYEGISDRHLARLPVRPFDGGDGRVVLRPEIPRAVGGGGFECRRNRPAGSHPL